MQICIDPTSPEGIDANLHRWMDAKLHRWVDTNFHPSMPQVLRGLMQICIDPPALRGSLQICIDPPSPGGIDANLHPNLHRSPKPWGDQ